MGRLTFEGNFCDIAQCNAAACPCGGSCTQKKVWERLKQYEDTGLEPEDVRRLQKDWTSLIMKLDEMGGMPHLHDLLQAEQDGRLVVLPCKVGATVYGHSKAEAFEYKVAVISLATYNWYLRCQNHNSDFWVTDADIGKTVFLTREEAEAVLEGGEG